jgi:hypothetical protein
MSYDRNETSYVTSQTKRPRTYFVTYPRLPSASDNDMIEREETGSENSSININYSNTWLRNTCISNDKLIFGKPSTRRRCMVDNIMERER